MSKILEKGAVMAGALDGVRGLEFASIGPVPICGMLLADMGADVLRIDRDQAVDLGLPVAPRYRVSVRGRGSVVAKLGLESAREALFKLIDTADVLIEGLRPGVMERLGFGPLAHTGGHDINHVAMTGALHAIGPADGPPSIPLDLLGDFAAADNQYIAIGAIEQRFYDELIERMELDRAALPLGRTQAASRSCESARSEIQGGEPRHLV